MISYLFNLAVVYVFVRVRARARVSAGQWCVCGVLCMVCYVYVAVSQPR
jgi:hypothetical protein